MDKLWHVHTMEHYPAWKRKAILTRATAWMKLNGIMLSEINLSQQANTVWFLYEVPGVVEVRETESRMAVSRGWAENGELLWEFRRSLTKECSVLCILLWATGNFSLRLKKKLLPRKTWIRDLAHNRRLSEITSFDLLQCVANFYLLSICSSYHPAMTFWNPQGAWPHP